MGIQGNKEDYISMVYRHVIRLEYSNNIIYIIYNNIINGIPYRTMIMHFL